MVTTCARDYVTWRNELPAGVEQVNGITVRRFPVRHERHPDRVRPAVAPRLRAPAFDRRRARLARERRAGQPGARRPPGPHRRRLRFRHPLQLSLLPRVARRAAAAGEGDPGADRRARSGDRAVDLRSDVPRRARRHVQLARRARDDPGGNRQPGRARRRRRRRIGRAGADRRRRGSGSKFNIRRPFAIYVGRIDENKGCKELFHFFQRYAATFPRGLDLVLVGSAIMPIPEHPRIHHLGFLSDEDKFDALAASDLLIMPSYFESLSMVALEAWALGRPVLANGRCDVLKGQCIRSNAGLYYERYEEFAETLYSLESNGPLHARLGRNGREYFRRHYAWPVIERKYLDMFDRLTREDAGGRRAADGAAARLARAQAAGSARGSGPPRQDSIRRGHARPGRGGRPLAVRMSPTPHRSARPPGPGDARLRRRHRPRGARHPARPARRRLRVGDLRRDRGPAPRGSDDRLPRPGRSCPPDGRADSPFLDRLARVAHRVRAARAAWCSSTTTSRRRSTSSASTRTW